MFISEILNQISLRKVCFCLRVFTFHELSRHSTHNTQTEKKKSRAIGIWIWGYILRMRRRRLIYFVHGKDGEVYELECAHTDIIPAGRKVTT